MTDGPPSTIFLRFEGPLQSWGDTSKFVIRRSMDAPTKSGVLGLICCAMGWSRRKVIEDPIPDEHLRGLAQRLVQRRNEDEKEPRRALLDLLKTLTMGVRIDRPGTRWWDWHTVGAKVGIMRADGKEPKKTASTGEYETLITRREYLADASFLVALQGDPILIETIVAALRSPKWQLYLGRKSCPPSMPVFAQPRKDQDAGWTNPMLVEGDLMAALDAVPWYPRYESDLRPESVDCLIEWRATDDEPTAPSDAEVWYDSPFSFDPPVHHPRLVMRETGSPSVSQQPLQLCTPAPPRPRADYNNSEYKKRRAARLESDLGLCVFCKSPATTVQHVTYRNAGGDEAQDDLRALCRLCHDAVTMIEYGLGMGLDRIDPCQPRWRDDILRTRSEIVRFRSEEGRRRALRSAPEKVRKEVLEEDV